MVRKVIVALVLAGFFTCICFLFWDQEVKYALPTAIPEDYIPIEVNSLVEMDSILPESKNRPRLLHFFSPECPCSRFNLRHFRSLYKKYKDHVDFYVVTPPQKRPAMVKEMVEVPVALLIDRDKKFARSCGVYSTPQAALITSTSNLYYRGNYNKARYCTNASSNYVQIALDSLMANIPAPTFPALATLSYGCEFPDTILTASIFDLFHIQ